jgi:hypothetical protein
MTTQATNENDAVDSNENVGEYGNARGHGRGHRSVPAQNLAVLQTYFLLC